MAVTGIHLLSPRQVQTAKAGDHADGGGLMLRISGINGNGSWVFRYTSPAGKRREMGLGKLIRNDLAAAGRSLVSAREEAEEARRLIRDAVDPIEAREAQRAQARQTLAVQVEEKRRVKATLARVACDYHERVIEPTRTEKHGRQWLSSLTNHVPDDLWHKPVADVTAPELLDFVAELQMKIPETASRIRQRLEAVFDDAEFRGLCTGNPARAIRGKLKESQTRRRKGNFAALPYREAPAFLRSLRKRPGISARALEFAMLTAARTGEVIGARWEEFDLDAGLWVIPGERMKGGEAHVVYLVPRALEILESMSELGEPWVFPAPTLEGAQMSNMAMLTLLRRMDKDKATTVHGLCRATFSTWAYETGAARPDVIEATLAHKEGDRVKAAYNRAKFAAERAALLLAWSRYLETEEPASNVVDLPAARAAA